MDSDIVIGTVVRVVNEVCLLQVTNENGKCPFLAKKGDIKEIKPEDIVVAQKYSPSKLFGELIQKI